MKRKRGELKREDRGVSLWKEAKEKNRKVKGIAKHPPASGLDMQYENPLAA